MATHQENKNRRRLRILEAARELIRAGENGDFSMVALSGKAGVGLVTPYNLFGSKAQIIIALHKHERALFAEQMEKLDRSDPYLLLIQMLANAVRVYMTDERYFANFHKASYTSPEEVQHYFLEERDKFWLSLMTDAAQSGLLSKAYDVKQLSRFCSSAYSACVRDWAMGFTPSQVLFYQMGYNLSLSLLGVVRPSLRKQVEEHLAEFEHKLSRVRKGAARTAKPTGTTAASAKTTHSAPKRGARVKK